MMEFSNEWCLHEDTQEILLSLGSTPWTTIYKKFDIESEDPEDRYIWSFIIDKNLTKSELVDYQFEHFNGYPSTGNFYNDEEKNIYYRRYGIINREPLVFNRSFVGKKGYLEISQEFIHFFQLYFDEPHNQFIFISPEGKEEVVARIINGIEVQVLTLRLKQFAAFKEMDVVICVSIRRYFDKPINGNFIATNTKQLLINQTTDCHYAIWYQECWGRTKYFSELIGKKVLQEIPIEKTGIDPFLDENKFEDFIVGQDEFGKPIISSCDPKGLSNYYGKNFGKPHYLTPVFFTKNVLQKYYADPDKYSIDDGIINIGQYSLRADTNNFDYVVVFLGDLGSDIPYSEQQYWKSFNVVPSGKLSSVEFERSFLGQFTDPQAEHFVFKNSYQKLQTVWEQKFGWPFFKPLHQNDSYRIVGLRIPVNNSQQEFDQQVESLCIVLIDAINQSKFVEFLKERVEKERSIQTLERFCKQNKLQMYEEHISFLQDLYRLRSLGASHRKDSRDYPKIRTHFRIDEEGCIKSFRYILKQATSVVDYFIST